MAGSQQGAHPLGVAGLVAEKLRLWGGGLGLTVSRAASCLLDGCGGLEYPALSDSGGTGGSYRSINIVNNFSKGKSTTVKETSFLVPLKAVLKGTPAKKGKGW